MSDDQMSLRDFTATRFGSAFRAGRDDPHYQLDRLRMLCGFAVRLLDAHRRRLLVEERRGREVWRGKQWLDQQRENWQRLAVERERMLDEQRSELDGKEALLREQTGWIAELEGARDWLQKEHQQVQRQLEQQENVIKELRAWVQELEKAKDWLETQWKQHDLLAKQQDGVIRELRQWGRELQQASAWHDEQRQKLDVLATGLQETVRAQQAQLARLDAQLQREHAEQARMREASADWKRQWLFRILRRLRLLRDLTFA